MWLWIQFMNTHIKNKNKHKRNKEKIRLFLLVKFTRTYFFGNIIQIQFPSRVKFRNFYKLERCDVTWIKTYWFIWFRKLERKDKALISCRIDRRVLNLRLNTLDSNSIRIPFFFLMLVKSYRFISLKTATIRLGGKNIIWL